MSQVRKSYLDIFDVIAWHNAKETTNVLKRRMQQERKSIFYFRIRTTLLRQKATNNASIAP